MNKSIKHTALFSVVLILILLIALTGIQAFREDELAQNPANARGFYESRQVSRGQIATEGQVLAVSEADENGWYQRSYPTQPEAYGAVLGYFSDRYGTAGLESGFNGVLSGTSGTGGIRWSDSNQQGDNLELTLLPQVQEVAYDQLLSNGYEGAAVALRPSTGEVLAMASTPSYDPNAVVKPETAETAWENLNNQPGQPLLNHASQETLPPGSIFKVITTSAALKNGYTPESPVTGAPAVTLPGTYTELTNYAGQACAGSSTVTLATAFALSCNTAFVEMSEAIGADGLRAEAEAYGVGQSYDMGIPVAPGTVGELPDPAATAQSAIGQRDVTMSALQAAVMAATVANEGRRMAPYLVSEVTTPDLRTVSTTEPELVTEATTPEEAAVLHDLMLASERATWGYDGNNFASKTGTAEHGGEEDFPHVWYVAYDPDKDVAVGVVVKDGGGFGHGATGGRIAAPIGRAILYSAPAPEGGE